MYLYFLKYMQNHVNTTFVEKTRKKKILKTLVITTSIKTLNVTMRCTDTSIKYRLETVSFIPETHNLSSINSRKSETMISVYGFIFF